MEFGRRLAVERELVKSTSMQFYNASKFYQSWVHENFGGLKNHPYIFFRDSLVLKSEHSFYFYWLSLLHVALLYCGEILSYYG